VSKIYDLGVLNSGDRTWQGVLTNDTYFSSAKFHEDPTSNRTMARLFIPMTPAQANQYAQTVRANVKSQDVDDILNALVVSVEESCTIGGGYLYFLLSQATEPLQEAVNIVKTAGEQYVTYAYGSQPPVFSYSGVLMNTLQDDWRTAFLLLYMFLIRTTQLAKYQKSVVLAYDNLLITGSLLSQQQTFNAEAQRHSMLNFSMLVKKITILNREPLHPDLWRIKPRTTAKGFISPSNDLLGLVSSVSGTGVSATDSLKVLAASPRRSRDDTPPTDEAMQLETLDRVLDEVGSIASQYDAGYDSQFARTRLGYKVGTVYPEAVREPDLLGVIE